MRERIIHGLCRGKQSDGLSAGSPAFTPNRTVSGEPETPTTKILTLRRTKCEKETFQFQSE